MKELLASRGYKLFGTGVPTSAETLRKGASLQDLLFFCHLSDIPQRTGEYVFGIVEMF